MLTTHYKGFQLVIEEYRCTHDETCYVVEISDPEYSYYNDNSQEPGVYYHEILGRYFDVTFYQAVAHCDTARGIDPRPWSTTLMSDN